jgi:hypothetical protein
MQKQNPKKTLLCTYRKCKEPQDGEGEFCPKHYPNNNLIQLKKDLKATLNNQICRYQSLDIAADRNRVLKEILKTLENYEITIKCITCENGTKNCYEHNKIA